MHGIVSNKKNGHFNHGKIRSKTHGVGGQTLFLQSEAAIIAIFLKDGT